MPFSAVIINPVCNEIGKEFINVDLPIALDIQGFIRNCYVGEEIAYSKPLLPSSNNFLVFHSNIEEFTNADLKIEELFNLGFKELLISYNEDGFEFYTKNTRKFITSSKIGEYKTGTGDVLLASYLYFRLRNIQPLESAIKAKEFVEWFSSEGYRELFHIM